MPHMSPHRGEAQPFVKSLSFGGYSTDFIQHFLQSQGVGYRRADIIADVQRYRVEAHNAVIARSLSDNDIVPRSIMSPTELHLTDRYRFDFNVTSKNLETGVTTTQRLSMSAGEIHSVAALESQMRDILGNAPNESPPYQVIDVQFSGGVIRKGEDYIIAADDNEF